MLPPSILQDESSAEERIQEADDPIPYISKYEPLHTATATLLAISLISCCMEGDVRRCSVTQAKKVQVLEDLLPGKCITSGASSSRSEC